MAFGNGAHQEKTEAGAANLPESAAGHTVKALKNCLQFRARNADPSVLHSQDETLLLFYRELDGNINVVARILHRVIQNVGDGGAQIFGIAGHSRTAAVQRRLIPDCVWLKVMAGARAFDAVFHQLRKVYRDALSFAASFSRL